MNPVMILMNPAEESVENIISNDQNFKMINYKEKNENFHSSKFPEVPGRNFQNLWKKNIW